MSTPMTFADPRLATLDGFRVEIDRDRERADVILDRPPFNVIEMPQRDQLRLVFEALDERAEVRIIVLRGAGEHFSRAETSRASSKPRLSMFPSSPGTSLLRRVAPNR
jgi:2-oxoglutaroyl-CoA hydrolase